MAALFEHVPMYKPSNTRPISKEIRKIGRPMFIAYVLSPFIPLLREAQKYMDSHLAIAEYNEKEAKLHGEDKYYWRAAIMMMDAYKEIDKMLEAEPEGTKRYERLSEYRNKLIYQALSYLDSEQMHACRDYREVHLMKAECMLARLGYFTKYVEKERRTADVLEHFERGNPSYAKMIAIFRLHRELQFCDDFDSETAALTKIVAAIAELQPKDLGQDKEWLRLNIDELLGHWSIGEGHIESLQAAKARLLGAKAVPD